MVLPDKMAFSAKYPITELLQDYGYKKFFFISVILILVCFNNNLLRSMKLTCIMEVPYAGIEIFSFLKVWGLMPAIFLFTSLYFHLAKKLTYEQIFCVFIGIFLLFFLCFLCFFYPKNSLLEIASVQILAASWLPKCLYSIVLMVKYWHFSLFYIFAELWSSVMLSLLVWGLINDNTFFYEAKAIYPIFLLIANLTAIGSGEASQMLTCKTEYHLNLFDNAWQQSFTAQLLVVTLLCGLILIIFLKFNNVLKKDSIAKIINPPSVVGNGKISVSQELTSLLAQNTILHIAILVFSYTVIYNLFEIIWINQIKINYPNLVDFNLYFGGITKYIGTTGAIASVVFILLNKFRLSIHWIAKACFLPITCFIVTILFLLSFYQIFGILTTNMTLLLGSCQIILGRVCKYTIFDETKEAAFTTLPQNIRMVGKTVVDLFSFKLGQFASNLLLQILLIFFLNVTDIIPYLISIVIMMVVIWAISVIKLWRHLSYMLLNPLFITMLLQDMNGNNICKK
jgi:AAA family ATP:ADP antiporter